MLLLEVLCDFQFLTKYVPTHLTFHSPNCLFDMVNHIDPVSQCLKTIPFIPFHLDMLSTNMRVASGFM